MKIKFLCRRYVPGEAWTNRVLAYAKGLCELGCDVELNYLISDKTRSSYTIPLQGVTINNLWESDNCLSKRNRIVSYFFNLLRFRRNLKKGDLVYIYGAEDKWLLRASIKKGVKVLAEITEHPYIYNKDGKNGEKSIDKKCLFFNKLDGLIVITRSLENYFQSIGIDKEKIRVSNMFVDADRFDIVRDLDVDPYIAYCGVISLEKDGVDILIKSFSKFHISHPEYKLYLIGRFQNSEAENTVKSLVDRFDLKNHIVFTGQVSPEEMPKLLVNARILALARPDNIQAQGGFPTKLGEYLATGNPVVVTGVGEIPLFIKDGYNGYLANPGDSNDFFKKMIQVADNYEEAVAVAKKGKELTVSDFSYLSQSKILYNLFNKQI